MPVVILAILSIVIIKSIYSFIKNRGHNTIIKRIALALFLVFSVYMIFDCTSKLASGGSSLIRENESYAIEINGEVEQISYIGKTKMPLFKTEYGYGEKSGVEISISGIVLKGPGCIMAYVKVGDRVTVKYLPDSGYILSITNTEEG